MFSAVLLTCALSAQLIQPGNNPQNPNEPGTEFRIWVVGDPHVKPGESGLYDAIVDMQMANVTYNIGVIVGDTVSTQGCPTDALGQLFVSQFQTPTQRAKFYCLAGNHDADTAFGIWFKRWVDPVGVFRPTSTVDNQLRPFHVNGDAFKYFVQVGNLELLLLGDSNSMGPPFGRTCNGGYPAGSLTYDAWTMLDERVAASNGMLLVFSHQALLETTAYTGYDEGFLQGLHGGQSWADQTGSSMIYAVGTPPGTTWDWWTVDGLDENQINRGARTYGPEVTLTENPGKVLGWFHGHSHKGMYPGKTFNGRSDIALGYGNATFCNVGMVGFLHGPPEVRYSRLIELETGSDQGRLRTFIHGMPDGSPWMGINGDFYPDADITFTMAEEFEL